MDNINENIYRDSIKYNSDGTVNVPFGRVAEWYINNVPMLKVCRLKRQSRQKTPQLVKEGFIEVKRPTDAIDFLEWKTKQGAVKSTNRLDDIIVLTPKGQELLQGIQLKLKKDRRCLYWVLYCSGDGNNCQRVCGGVGECLQNCQNRAYKGNLKNSNDMHLCNVRVILECQISWLISSTPLKITIQGIHVSHNLPVTQPPQVTRINLDLKTRHTAQGIKVKMLTPLNGATEEEIKKAFDNKKKICSNNKLRKLIARDDKRLKDNVGPWTILHNMIEKILKPNGFVLHYQVANPDEHESSLARYYQLTVSDDFWLRNGRDFGKICIGLDGKYDLNVDRAPVLSIVLKNNAGCGTPLAFALSNRENHMTIHIAILAVKQNIPCNDNNCSYHWYYENLSNGNGFQRITPYSQNNIWNPYMMIDKHRPSKLGIEGLTCGVILCWFHIMQALGNSLKEWQIPQQLRYPIAIAFKIIGRCRSDSFSRDMFLFFSDFIQSLSIENHKKNLIINGIKNNWMSDEWRSSFIDAGRIIHSNSNNFAPWTTNNFTERIHRTIETVYSGKQTVLSFLERLYGVKLSRDNLTENIGQVNFEAGLVTLFNAQSIEQQNQPVVLTSDQQKRLNKGRLCFLLNMTESSNHNNNYYYVKKSKNSNIFISPYDDQIVEFNEEIMNRLSPMIHKLAEKSIQEAGGIRSDYYIVNVITGECPLCLDYIWNGPFRDVCKHVHAARIYSDYLKSHNYDEFFENIKYELVTYFKNKQRVLPTSNKNSVIYNGSIEEAYQEIIRLYNLQGNLIFNSTEHSVINHVNDPFRPDGLNNHMHSKLLFKSKKRNQLQPTLKLPLSNVPPAPPISPPLVQSSNVQPHVSPIIQLSNVASNVSPTIQLSSSTQSLTPQPFSVQKRQTKRIRQNLRKKSNKKNKENIQQLSTASDNARFILPSPKKPKLTEYDFNEFDFEELESSIESESEQDIATETCPFCDAILSNPKSDKMKLALDKLNNKQGRVSQEDQIEFCYIHFAESSIIPSGIANNYPLAINFDELPGRIHKFKDNLIGIINGTTYSYYLNLAKQIYNSVGHKRAATPMMVMNRFQSLRPGYYGTKGAVLIANTLIDLFLTAHVLTYINSFPLQPCNYIQEVLVPETAMRLISEDIGGNCSLETSRKIMIESSDFGEYVHSD